MLNNNNNNNNNNNMFQVNLARTSIGDHCRRVTMATVHCMQVLTDSDKEALIFRVLKTLQLVFNFHRCNITHA